MVKYLYLGNAYITGLGMQIDSHVQVYNLATYQPYLTAELRSHCHEDVE